MEPSFWFVCGISGCVHCFGRRATFESFKTQAFWKHPRWQELVNETEDPLASEISLSKVTPQSPVVRTPKGPLSSPPFKPCTDTAALLVSPSINRPTRTASTPQHTAALFLLTFKVKYRLSQNAIDYAVGSINMIVDSVCSSIQDVL